MSITEQLHPADDCAATAARLLALDEPMAAGLYEGLHLPHPRQFGMAYRRLYEHMGVVIDDAHLIFPREPFPHSRDRRTANAWYANAYIMDFKHNAGSGLNRDIFARKQEAHPDDAAFLQAVWDDLLTRHDYFGGYTHSNPDMRRVLAEGFLAMEAELDEQLAADDLSAEERHLLDCMKDYCIGVRAYHARVQQALNDAAGQASGQRRAELETMANAFADGFMQPAESFLAGLMAVNFTWMLDGCDSIGRYDQYLGPLYEQDIASGRLDPEFARRLLDEVFENFERMNGWNLQIGGWTPENRDGCNALTNELIDACARNHYRRPNVALRITSQTPDAVLERAIAALRDGSGRPALYNDDLYVKTLEAMDLGLTAADAREIGFGGCTETMIAGLSNCGSLESQQNFAKMLEYALFDGRDPATGEQHGPHTGRFADFAGFDDFRAALERQMQYVTDAWCAKNKEDLKRRAAACDPKPFRTFFTRDCIRNRKSFDGGGARYNWAVVSYQGIANLIDSLAAIRHCVYTEKSIAPEQLIAALEADFAGEYEAVRETLMRAPRFGNDIPEVDELGAAIMGFAWDCLYAHETPRGGRYLASCILFATYGGAGVHIGALPDGRRAGTPLTDSVGPVQGRDVNGPTAMLKSVARLPLDKAVGTPVLNIRFQKPLLEDRNGIAAVVGLIRTFFRQGGMQIQLSVLSKEEMLDAQEHPRDHQDLIVRIGGYSEYFCQLDRNLQDTVIARTEHGM